MEPDFWNSDDSKKVVLKLNELKKIVSKVDGFSDLEHSLRESLTDNELLSIVAEEIENLSKEVNDFEILTLLNKEADSNNCILEIHSGAGGTESCDWVSMLYRMYTRYASKKGYKVTLIDKEPGEEVGYKSISIQIEGMYAYGYLKCERGVHRLVRISPFDSNKRRHTTFASVEVTPEIDNKIDIVIKDEDLKIDVYRSSGAGGQHVNTTDSAVRITHLPTKIVVSCQNQRSQIQNREEAINMLKSKLKLLELEKRQQELQNVKGESMNIEFGSQIRSYVMHPYSLVKDHRTGYETSNVLKVLDGDIFGFIESYLKQNAKK